MLLGFQLSGVEGPCHAQLVGSDVCIPSGQQLVAPPDGPLALFRRMPDL